MQVVVKIGALKIQFLKKVKSNSNYYPLLRGGSYFWPVLTVGLVFRPFESPTHHRQHSTAHAPSPTHLCSIISLTLVAKACMNEKDTKEIIIRFLFISPDSVLRKNIQFCFSQQIGAQSVLKYDSFFMSHQASRTQFCESFNMSHRDSH